MFSGVKLSIGSFVLFLFRYNSVEAVQILVSKGASVNEQNVYGLSALHFASRRGNTAIAKILLNQPGIEVNVKDNANVIPLHQAAVSGDVEIGEELIKRGGNIYAEDIEGESPLHFAASEGNGEFIELLLKTFGFYGMVFMSLVLSVFVLVFCNKNNKSLNITKVFSHLVH